MEVSRRLSLHAVDMLDPMPSLHVTSTGVMRAMLLQDPILRIGQTTIAPVECSAIEFRGAATKLL